MENTDLNIIVDEYYDAVRWRVHQKVPEADVDDVTQDIFLHLFRSIDSFKGRSVFSTWFGQLERNRIADYHRIKERRLRNLEKLPLQVAIYQATQGERCETLDMLALLERLPEHYKEALWLRHYEQMTFREIADRLGLSYEAARSRTRRATRFCRKLRR